MPGVLGPRNLLVIALAIVTVIAPGVATAEERPAPPPRQPYVIGLEDGLHVHVYNQPELSGRVTVRPDGKITVPLVGDLVAEGRTPVELSADITDALSQFVREPVVTVSVEAINHYRVYLLGEVGAQGEMQLSGPTRILHVIAKAGGLSPYADRSNIQILRYNGDEEIRIRVDYRKIVNGSDPSMNIMLEPGDVVLVK